MRSLNRRQFIQTIGASGLLTLTSPTRALTYQPRRPATGPLEAVRFGVIADVHHGLAPDADNRLTTFIDDCLRQESLDFIIQLGDFCHPTSEANAFIANWNRFPGPKRHVLGNHDMDHGAKADIMKKWGMSDRYASFDAGPYRFVTLDLNNLRDGDEYTGYANGNFYVESSRRAWMDPDQCAWLNDLLAETERPTVLFSHQPFGLSLSGGPVPEQQMMITKVIDEANRTAGWSKVIAAFVGHLHADRAATVNDVHYVCINSASYHWAEGMWPYRDALYAFVTLCTDGSIRIEGVESVYVDGSPIEAGLRTDAVGAEPRISDRTFRGRSRG